MLIVAEPPSTWRPLCACQTWAASGIGSTYIMRLTLLRLAHALVAYTAEGCRSRTFVPDRSSARCIDWQKVRLQELVGADQQQQGRVPRTVEVRSAWQASRHAQSTMWCSGMSQCPVPRIGTGPLLQCACDLAKGLFR